MARKAARGNAKKLEIIWKHERSTWYTKTVHPNCEEGTK